MKTLLANDDFLVDQYVKWACLMLQTYLSEPSMVSETFPLIKELLSIVRNCNDDFSKGFSFSKLDDMLWIAVSIWNQSTYFWSVKDIDSGRMWSEMALEICQFCDDCEQIQNVIKS
jgi:hypothetical protein